MAVPRNRHSNARKLSKRSHNAKRPQCLSKCSECGKHVLPHSACLSCMTYRKRSLNPTAVAPTGENSGQVQ